jgi:hypothetical protein
MEGRYFVTDLTGHLKMPDPDGKPKDVTVSAVGLLPTLAAVRRVLGGCQRSLSVIAT